MPRMDYMKGLQKERRAWLAVTVIILVAMAHPAAADTPVVDVRPGSEGVFRVDGDVVRATSSKPDLVKIGPRNPSFPRSVFFECAAGKTGVATVGVTWRDEAGNEHVSYVVVACGVKIDKNVTVTGGSGESVAVNLPEIKGGDKLLSGGEVLVDGSPDSQSSIDVENGRTIFRLGKEGPLIILHDYRLADGKDLRVLFTVIIGPKKVSQLMVPADRVRQAVLQPNQCPGGLPYSAALSTPQTPAQFAGQGFEALGAPLQAAGLQLIHRTVCRGSAPVRFWNLLSHAGRVEATPVSAETMEKAFLAVRDFFKGRLQGVTEHIIESPPWGDQAVGLVGRFTLSSGEVNDMIFYVARYGNAVYWVGAQGQRGSVPVSFPETTVAQFMRQMKANLDAAVRN